MFSLCEKKASSQKMQKSTIREITENTNTDNYDRTNMWKKMISKHEISTTSFTTKLSQKLIMIQQENRMRIINTNLKQEWFMISETWQIILNDLLWKWLYYSFIRKKKEILFKNIKKLQRKEKNKIFSNYKKFMKKIITIFESVNSKKEAEHKLKHFKQKESASNYAVKFK